MNKKWNLMIVSLVALSAIVMGTACAVETMTMGPSGGPGGSEFTDPVDQLPCGTVAHQVNIRSGWWIDSLEMVVKTRDGAIQSLGKHGGDLGGPSQFTLADGEYITEVIGTSGTEAEFGDYVQTIEFATNLGNTYGPYGNENVGDSDFSYEAPDGWQIVGFIGRSAQYVDAIGVIAIPVAECCKDKDCEDAPCVKCDMETTTCTAPGEEEGQPHMMCDEGCVNTQNDDFNCGECEKQCDTGAGEKCVSGECKGKKIKG